MTNEEAIKILSNATFSDEWQGNEELTTAYLMAIEALKDERPKGEWIKKIDDVGFVSYICSECGFELELEDCSDSYYCSDCGADMRVTDNEC